MTILTDSLAMIDSALRASVWWMMMKRYRNLHGVFHNVDRFHRD